MNVDNVIFVTLGPWIEIEQACRGSKVPLRVLWCKAIGGGGLLVITTEREEAREDIYI